MNAPERFNTWRWEDEDNEKRLTYIPDTKVPNAGMFELGKEDHTIGNLIRIQLLRDPAVRFAGYRVPHPLIFDAHVKVQTMDHSATPISVFVAAVEDLKNETEVLRNEFIEAINAYKSGGM
mmetsp:Transcript_34603/g.35286  ORF Transcript_34603/g.35286 Transcript_34603/m.35286 type:complete len:121 (+) Transcript_34603:47-409(+)